MCFVGVSFGVVRPGMDPGAVSTRRPRASRTAAVPEEAARRHGMVFSNAMSAAITAIHTTLMIPNANSAAIRAQQQPTHHAPFFAPIRSAPDRPSRHEPSRNPSGLRHFPRQTSFNGVSSYTAAATSVPPAVHRPTRSHANRSPEVELRVAAIANARTPAAAQVRRYPAANSSGDNGDRCFVMREYSATTGAIEGNIIAAIITTQTPRNQPNEPRPVHGPLSIPRIWSPVHHQPTAATTSSSATRPRRARTADSAGAKPPPAGKPAGAVTLMASGGPGELGRRQAGLALVLDPEGVDA